MPTVRTRAEPETVELAFVPGANYVLVELEPCRWHSDWSSTWRTRPSSSRGSADRRYPATAGVAPISSAACAVESPRRRGSS